MHCEPGDLSFPSPFLLFAPDFKCLPRPQLPDIRAMHTNSLHLTRFHDIDTALLGIDHVILKLILEVELNRLGHIREEFCRATSRRSPCAQLESRPKAERRSSCAQNGPRAQFFWSNFSGKFLTIFGIPSGSDESPANSSEADFFKIYSNSDFMKHFDTIKKDHETIVEPSEISLSCKAVVRFMPYNGFYPAERTVDLATQFSKSVGPYIQYNGSDADSHPNIKFRNILTPFFAPGIVYNTIKSGIACDYPIYNMGDSAFSNQKLYL